MIDALGIDIGGSGIKGAPVDLTTGAFVGERYRIPTPEKSTPKNVAEVVGQIAQHFSLPKGTPIGITVPAPIIHGVASWMANLHKSWAGTNVNELFSDVLGTAVSVVNDADAAGYGEVEYGAAKGQSGTVLVTTLGTGIGSALIINHQLVPNTELGHLVLPGGKEAEPWASAAAKERKELSWKKWATRLQVVYSEYEKLLSPDLIIVGGGISKHADKFLPLITTNAPLIPAQLRNSAGIIGAAALAVKDNK